MHDYSSIFHSTFQYFAGRIFNLPGKYPTLLGTKHLGILAIYIADLKSAIGTARFRTDIYG